MRRYEKQAGSEDSSLTWQHYYDDSGRLRFVFISGGAVNGARLEHRIYFDESGQRAWESHQYLKGPHYSFPKVWPDEQLQKVDPAKAFSAPSPCPETKVRKQPKKTTWRDLAIVSSGFPMRYLGKQRFTTYHERSLTVFSCSFVCFCGSFFRQTNSQSC